jgi:NAD(P)-dependent dehydrogenase (short-subunit alcohol dehydrogenase family)
MKKLNEAAGPTLVTVPMDVTKPQQVQAAVQRIEEETPEGLFALVNNAGVCVCVVAAIPVCVGSG